MNTLENPARLPSVRELNAHICNLFIQTLKEAGDNGRTEIGYEELSQLVNNDIKESGIRSLLNRARKTVLKDYGYLFETKVGVGLRLLPDKEKVERIGASRRKQIKNTTTAWRSEHDSINPQKLDQAGLKALVAEELRLSCQEEMESTRMNKRIDAAVEGSSKRITHDEIRRAIHESNRLLAGLG